jgi:hypothetical protein
MFVKLLPKTRWILSGSNKNAERALDKSVFGYCSIDTAMKLILILTGIVCTAYGYVSAQENRMLRVKAGEDARKVIPARDQYQFAEFQPGTVTYTTGKSSDTRLNYNLLLGEMQFIAPQGDTLSLANEHVIGQISVDEQTFYYGFDKGYLELLRGNALIGVVRKQLLIPAGSEKVGAYGQSSGVSSIRTYNSLAVTNSQLYKLQPQVDVLFTRNVTYYLMDHNGRFHLANKPNLYKILPKYRKKVQQYLKDNRTNFSSEADLVRLVEFCQELL